MRCRHGFEPTAVKCPEGCHGPAPGHATQRQERLSQRFYQARDVTNQDIVDALATEGNAMQAAKKLGINVGTIHNRAKRCVAVRAALDGRDFNVRQMGSHGGAILAKDEPKSRREA